jgi:hypothetical protein
MRLNFLAAVVLTAIAVPNAALAQSKTIKEQIVGTWTLTSFEQTYPDGRKDQAFSSSPKGVQTFDSNGHFTLIFLRPDLPKIASGNRGKLTPRESQAIAVGSAAYYGTYTVDEQEKSLDLKLDGTMNTNQLGVPQKRIITMLNAEELRYRNPVSTSGGTIEVALRRPK